MSLPVVQIFPALEASLSQGDVLLVAPPGAGKSTCLPLFLLGLARFKNCKIILLQPRRIAVRSIASYLAEQLQEPVGKTVGYRMRGENKVSSHTRLEIVTEGILTRMLQSQPELDGIGLVIFDEFHERSIHADLSLALCLEVQQTLRDDLRLLVMSATLDIDALQRFMPHAELLQCAGRSYPVTLHYRPDLSKQPLSAKVVKVIREALENHQGSILVFLPGVRDIQYCAQALSSLVSSTTVIHSLYGELDKKQQMAAIAPCIAGQRKIVLATNIAETSLTIDGIEVVIDSGLEKTAQFRLTQGVTQLVSQGISQSSATQRAGRAGRTASGHCYRLWAQEQHGRLSMQSQPELLHVDIMPLLLECALWGTPISQLGLINQPSTAQIERASQSLLELQAIDTDGKITAHGRALHGFGSHPSLANMLVTVQKMSAGHQSMAAAIVALLESKDPLPYQASVSLEQRLQLLQQQRSHPIWQSIRLWQQRIGCGNASWPLGDSGLLLALAFPQWLAKQRQPARLLLVNGSGASLAEHDPLAQQPWLAVGNMLVTDKQQGDTPIKLAERISEAQLQQHFGHLFREQHICQWDNQQQRIVAQRRKQLGQIVLSSQKVSKPDTALCQQLWLQQIGKLGVMNLPFSEQALQLIYRVRLAHNVFSDDPWPDWSEKGLTASLEQWLLPYLTEVLSMAQLQKLDFIEILKSALDWPLQQQLQNHFPQRFAIPSGNTAALIYAANGSVKLSVRMQELYGLQETPTIARGKVAVQLELLSPARRPLQQTQNLAGFWSGSYKEVQKEMKGRYPRHFWPDDPATAQATSKTKKNM
ncbi:ATP-dependent helicase HrpB [Alteromonadaceae bacterium BrNp21-10]|nr:ATP-dependent helicase HrpB [Alteromonadaceae bacterium BrNp21-10]